MLGRYLGASIAALSVDYSIYLLLLRLVPDLSPVGAAVPGYVAGIVVHYGLSRRFVFPAGWLHGRPLGELLLFVLTGAVGTAVTALVVWLLSMVPGTGVHWPKVAAIVVSFFTTYGLRKLVVFRRDAA